MLMLIMLLLAIVSPSPLDTHTVGGVSYPHCVSEDAPGPCYWDGGANGKGEPFLVDDDGAVSYFTIA